MVGSIGVFFSFCAAKIGLIFGNVKLLIRRNFYIFIAAQEIMEEIFEEEDLRDLGKGTQMAQINTDGCY